MTDDIDGNLLAQSKLSSYALYGRTSPISLQDQHPRLQRTLLESCISFCDIGRCLATTNLIPLHRAVFSQK